MKMMPASYPPVRIEVSVIGSVSDFRQPSPYGRGVCFGPLFFGACRGKGEFPEFESFEVLLSLAEAAVSA